MEGTQAASFAAGEELLRIEYVPLDDLLERFDASNPKDHDVGALAESMEEFGYTAPPTIDETTGRLVAGHGRLVTLRMRRGAGEDPPDRVRIDGNGAWLVPTVRGMAFEHEQQARAYLIADNRLTELGGWELAALVEELQKLEAADALTGTGFDRDDLDNLLRDLEASDKEVFKTFDEGIETEHECPACGFKFS